MASVKSRAYSTGISNRMLSINSKSKIRVKEINKIRVSKGRIRKKEPRRKVYKKYVSRRKLVCGKGSTTEKCYVMKKHGKDIRPEFVKIMQEKKNNKCPETAAHPMLFIRKYENLDIYERPRGLFKEQYSDSRFLRMNKSFSRKYLIRKSKKKPWWKWYIIYETPRHVENDLSEPVCWGGASLPASQRQQWGGGGRGKA